MNSKAASASIEDRSYAAAALQDEAVRQRTAEEHQMTFLEAVKLYPTAIGWSVFFSMGIIMTGKSDCAILDFDMY